MKIINLKKKCFFGSKGNMWISHWWNLKRRSLWSFVFNIGGVIQVDIKINSWDPQKTHKSTYKISTSLLNSGETCESQTLKKSRNWQEKLYSWSSVCVFVFYTFWGHCLNFSPTFWRHLPSSQRVLTTFYQL